MATPAPLSPLALWPRQPLPEDEEGDEEGDGDGLDDAALARVFAEGGLVVDLADLPTLLPTFAGFDPPLLPLVPAKRQVARIRIKALADTSAWDERGTCHIEGWPPDTFYPTRHSAPADIALARSICGRCPVRDHCLAHSLTLRERGGGIWGGETADERRVTRREWKAAKKAHPRLSVLTWTREHLRERSLASREAHRADCGANPA